jgi:hypothetical protein
MVVDDLDIRRAGGVGRPFEADAPLLIDADGILPGTVASQRFEALPALACEALERPHELAVGELLRASAPVAPHHGRTLK